jgi:peptidoglycan/LPS O-acetylase OafA/YrhL
MLKYNNNSFDFLRFFFAADILLAHLWELSQNNNLLFLKNFSNSSIAVKGFFVISGFLVTKSYKTTPSLKHYFIKRAKRILPAYVFVILFSVIVLSFFSTIGVVEYFSNTETYKYLAWNIIFLNFMNPCLPGIFQNNLMCAVNGALWTIKVEEGFYIILPLLFYLFRKTKRIMLIAVSLYVLSVFYWYVLDIVFQKPLLAKQLPGYLSYFLVGILINLNFESFLKYKTKLILLSLIILIILNFICFKIDFFYPSAFGILIIGLAYSMPFLNNFGKYGDFTYGIYIFHFPIIQIFRQYNLFERFNPIIMAFSVLTITFLLALFSWFFIEKNFLDRYKRNNNLEVN